MSKTDALGSQARAELRLPGTMPPKALADRSTSSRLAAAINDAGDGNMTKGTRVSGVLAGAWQLISTARLTLTLLQRSEEPGTCIHPSPCLSPH